MFRLSENHKAAAAIIIGTGLAAKSFALNPTGAQAFVVFTALICFLSSGLMLQKEIGVFRTGRLTIPSWLYITYMLMIFFPALTIFSSHAGIYRYYFVFSVQITAVVFSAGIVATNRLLKSGRAEIDTFYARDLVSTEPPYLRVGFVILLALSLILTIIYLLEVKTVPLFHLFSDTSPASLQMMRENSFKLLNSRLIYFFSWLRGTIYPLLILISAGNYYVSRDKWWLAFFGATVAPGLFFISLSIEKAPVAAIFVMLLFLLYLIKQGRIGGTGVATLIFLALTFPVAVFKGMSQSSALNLPVQVFGLLTAVSNRIFVVPAYTLYYYFEIFPAKVGFLWGDSIRLLAALLGHEPFNLSNYVFNYMYDGIKSGLANAAFPGDLWANFGIFGVIAGGLFVGVLLQTIHIVLIRKEKSVLNLAVYAWFIYLTSMLSSTSVFIVILSHGLVVALLIRAALDRRGRPDKNASQAHEQVTHYDRING